MRAPKPSKGPAAARKRVVMLRADAVYCTPLGRYCRWLPPAPGDGRPHGAVEVVHFEYVPAPGEAAVPGRHAQAAQWPEGFTLARRNLHLLTEVVDAAAR